jgi:hypothetical protein
MGAGCDGRQLASGDLHWTKRWQADGKAVWSWRRDRGVKLAGSLPPMTVAINAAHRGEHGISRNTIARGKPGCLGCTCLIRVLSFTTIAHGAAGASSARLSLRPPLLARADDAGPGRKSRRGNAEVRRRAGCLKFEIGNALRARFTSPRLWEGRIASKDAIRVRGYRSIGDRRSRRAPLTPPSPRKSGARERESDRPSQHYAPFSSIALKSARARCASAWAASQASTRPK